MKQMAKSNVFLFGAGGLGIEIGKTMNYYNIAMQHIVNNMAYTRRL